MTEKIYIYNNNTYFLLCFMQKTPGKWLLLAGGIVLVMALIVGIMGRGWFSNLGSNAFGNVCTKASLMSGEAKYIQSGLDISKLSQEATQLQKIISLGKQEIKKNDSQIKKFEKEEKETKKTISNVEKEIKEKCNSVNSAGGRGSAKNNAMIQKTCDQLKQKLQNQKQNLKWTQNSLSREETQNKKRNNTVKNAESKLANINNKIQDSKSYIAAYDSCKKTVSGEVNVSGEVTISGEVAADFSMTASGEVNVGQPFTITVKALKTWGAVLNNYNGTIYFGWYNSELFCYLDGVCGNEIMYPENLQYTFKPSDNGLHSFTNWFTITKAGIYRIYMYGLWTNGQYGWVEKFVQILVK